MLRKLVFLCLLSCLINVSNIYAQSVNRYGLNIIDKQQVYLEKVAADSNNRLVEIKRYIPDIRLDIRYATSNNFTGQAVYEEARAFARLPVVLALKSVQNELKKKGLGLKIYDAYRPYSVTVKFFEVAEDKNFVASPKTGSRHNRGCAIDLTLVNLKSGRELKMPTPYDSFAPEAAPAFTDLPQRVKTNRDLLRKVMENHGFKVLHNEWWHFDYKNWENFQLMDIPFSSLKSPVTR